MVRAWGVAMVCLVLGCGSSHGDSAFNDGGNGSSGGGSGSGSGGSGSGGGDASLDGTVGFGDGSTGDGGSCTAPDMLIVLDHTDSMSAQPNGGRPPNTMAGHMLTKWYLATQAIKSVVAPPMDQKVAYGLEPFPLDPQVVTDAGGTGKCETLTNLLAGTASTNTSCEAGEVLVSPATGTGMTISNILDPETMRLCVSTPIALALDTAKTELASIAKSGVAQYVLLVTDGGETCKGDVVGVTQQLAAAGIKTYVIGFGSVDAGAAGVNTKLLDNVACAGETAPAFPGPCTKGDAGGYTATSTSGPPLFFLAEDGASLQAALQAITGSICCGCAQ